MRTTRPLAGSFGTEVDLSYVAMACPDLHSDLDRLGISSKTRYWVFDEVYDVNQSSVEVRDQVKGEARE